MKEFIIKTEEQILAQQGVVNVPRPATIVTRPLAETRIGATIAIQNLSTILSDVNVAATVAALQIQLDRDWQPVWGTTATLVSLTRSQSIPTGAWVIYILDNSDYAGALGYHDETNTGRPYGRIFAKTCSQYGYSWTVTLSHELLEMMGDPYINLTVFRQNSNTAGRIYALEVGDPCEADVYGYRINNILVSDFVWPTWFNLYTTASRYDQRNVITAPFQILPGGYMSIFNVSGSNQWTQITHRDVVVGSGSPVGRNRRDR